MNVSKSLAVAQYLLDACKAGGDGSVTPMQLLKLVYIAHGYMLGVKSRPLLDESVEAWQYGPVVPSVYHAVKRFRSLPVQAVDRAPRDFAFSEDEKSIMNYVATEYGKFTGIQLSAATHRPDTPWHKTWAISKLGVPISNDVIESFYRDLLSRRTHASL